MRIHDAAEINDVATLREELERGVDVDAEEMYSTPLQLAAAAGSTEAVALLLKSGARLEDDDSIHSAMAEAASIEIVNLLTTAGWDINTISGTGTSVLKSAVATNNIRFVRELLAAGADPNYVVFGRGETSLHIAIRHDNLRIARELIRAGANVEAEDVDWDVPLYFAKSRDAVDLLLSHGASIARLDGCGRNMIAQHRNIELIDHLVKATADKEVIEAGLGELMVQAGDDGDFKLLDYLCSENANINAQNSWGKTSLHGALAKNHIEFARKLCELGSDVTLTDDNQRTALFYAAAPESLPAFQLMREGYAEVAARLIQLEEANGGKIPGDIRAIEPGSPYGYYPTDNTESIDLLMRHGAHIEATDKEGMTPLLLACTCGRPSKIETLLAHGANREHKTFAGQTACDLTASHHYEPHAVIIRSLVSR